MRGSKSNSLKWEIYLYEIIKLHSYISRKQLTSRIENLENVPSSYTISKILEKLSNDERIFKRTNENNTVYYSYTKEPNYSFELTKEEQITRMKNIEEMLKISMNGFKSKFRNSYRMLNTFRNLIELKNECRERLQTLKNVKRIDNIITLPNNPLTKEITFEICRKKIPKKEKIWRERYNNALVAQGKFLNCVYKTKDKSQIKQTKESKNLKNEYKIALQQFYEIDDKYFKLNFKSK